MKHIIFAALTLSLLACTPQVNQTQVLQNRIDSLEAKLADIYKPGFGELMNAIQLHHSKLWFAGKNQNWKLADFEVHEMMEAIDGIQKYDTERKETEIIGMILPTVDSVKNAIAQQNPAIFKAEFSLLTNTCNSCHKTTGYEFSVVKIPETSPYSNQDFRLQSVK